MSLPKITDGTKTYSQPRRLEPRLQPKLTVPPGVMAAVRYAARAQQGGRRLKSMPSLAPRTLHVPRPTTKPVSADMELTAGLWDTCTSNTAVVASSTCRFRVPRVSFECGQMRSWRRFGMLALRLPTCNISGHMASAELPVVVTPTMPG